MKKKFYVSIIAFALVFALCSIPAPAHAAMSDDDFLELCEDGTPEEIELAVKGGANVSAKNDSGETALYLAVEGNEDPKAAAVLIKAGADVNAGDDDGKTPLMVAALMREDDTDVLLMLIKAGAKIEAADDDEYTALHWAAMLNENTEVLKALLENGANIEAKDNFGETPLFNAVAGGKPKNILLLLDKGADADAENDFEETAVDMLPDSAPDGVDEKEWEAAAERLKRASSKKPSSKSAAEPDAEVDGLWLKCPSFPKDADLAEFNDGKELGIVEYSRLVDGAVMFTIRRQPIEDSQLQKPDDVQSLIEMRVSNDDGDADSIDVDTEADEFAKIFKHPCATASYQTGQNEDTRMNAAVFIFTGEYCFTAEVSVAADFADDYEEQALGWFKDLKFVEK